LVTIGIKPVSPSTGYGYIKSGLRKKGYIKADKFLEKPSLEKAKKYFKDSRFFWNSGMFVWKATVFLDEVKKHLPKLYANLKQINSVGDVPRVWPRIEPISVDYGVMERSDRIALIPSNFYWTDLGSWDALSEIFPKDKSGNIANSDTLNLDSQGVCVFARGNRLVSTIGVKDIVIADTPDALLVCSRDRTQDVKKLVDKLKILKRKEHQVHLTERRPWGSFTVLQEGSGFKIKIIEIAPKKRLSLQRHKSRAEHWVVVYGLAKVTSGKKISFVRSNQSIYISKGKKHRLENTTNQALRIVEVQTGSYVGEDDIERFDDDFKKEYRCR
jgi:mannose-1-phosphate guanylyltransferase/mannose-6-phosphate isomerase